jgi:hypothetical protein
MNTASKISFRSNEDTPLLAAGFFISAQKLRCAIKINHRFLKEAA